MMSFKNKLLLTALSLLSLAGCDLLPEDSTQSYTPSSVTAVVATTSTDYTTGAISVITGDDNRIAANELLAGNSDRTVNTFNDHFYILDRETQSTITKFNIIDSTYPVWQYSSQDALNEASSTNPHQIVFLSETKAYVLRYNRSTIWVVNPSATTAADFKTGEIDLSAYADVDGAPEMTMGVIANGKLFVAMQRLEYWSPVNNAYIAVIDTATDTEIDTTTSGTALKGIPLTIKNPTTSMQYLAADDSIYIQAIGSYTDGEFIGGIEKVDATTYETSLIIDDGTATTHPDERVSAMAIVSPTLGYYVSYISWGSNALYRFDPSTGAETPTTIGTLATGNFSNITVDVNGLIWLSDVANGNATVHVIDPQTDTLLDSVATVLNPNKISFINQ
ncbi:MAG: hypothetical protein OEY36_07110 [Gammaproteobacteria bacterium]|nr:hypothetical protein [Gammaproteobacteria bacterium]